MDKNIRLVELANTWQGEGPDTGRQMLIARFKHCNLHCSYCDTWIKMKTTVEGSYSISDINSALEKTGGLMVTGGEPTLETDSIHNLTSTLDMITYCNYQTANVETNGCGIEILLNNMVIKKNTIVNVMYSPKIFSDKDYKEGIEKVKNVISHPSVYLKIVADKTQLTEQFIREVCTLTNDKSKIYLMPMGVTSEEIASNWIYTIDLADECNINISTRMHIVHSFT
jgi:7-carboxy-7-deazaguanine synthase